MTTPGPGNASFFACISRSARNLAVGTACLLLIAACGPDLAQQPQTARPTEATQTDFGKLEVHYNAVRTDQLTPEIARAYGIERSANRVLLNVAMLEKKPGGAPFPVDGAVTVAAHNLNGQLKNMEMRRVQEGATIYFIGEVGISSEEILVFNITVEPRAGGSRHEMQFKREFFDD